MLPQPLGASLVDFPRYPSIYPGKPGESSRRPPVAPGIGSTLSGCPRPATASLSLHCAKEKSLCFLECTPRVSYPLCEKPPNGIRNFLHFFLLCLPSLTLGILFLLSLTLGNSRSLTLTFFSFFFLSIYLYIYLLLYIYIYI